MHSGQARAMFLLKTMPFLLCEKTWDITTFVRSRWNYASTYLSYAFSCCTWPNRLLVPLVLLEQIEVEPHRAVLQPGSAKKRQRTAYAIIGSNAWF